MSSNIMMRRDGCVYDIFSGKIFPLHKVMVDKYHVYSSRIVGMYYISTYVYVIIDNFLKMSYF